MKNNIFEFWSWFHTNQQEFQNNKFDRLQVRKLCFEYGFMTYCLDNILDKEKIEQEFFLWFSKNQKQFLLNDFREDRIVLSCFNAGQENAKRLMFCVGGGLKDYV